MKNFVALTGMMLLLFVGCSEEEQAATDKAAVKSVTVEARTIQPQKFEQYLKLVGSVEAQNDVRISAEVPGRIERYFVEQGDLVRKGAPLLKIDDSKLQREQARLQAQTRQAREQYERLKKVYEQEGIGSEIDVINAKSTYEQTKAALEAAEVDLRNTTVRAPFDATVEKVLMEQGEMAGTGAALVRLIGNDQLKVSAGVPANYADVVSKGDQAEIWFDYQQADTLHLPISFVGQAIDPQARTFEVEIKLPPQKASYKVDMLSNIKLRTLSKDSVVVIGKEYIYKNDNQNVVYIRNKDQQENAVARAVPIQLGASYKNNVVISRGLSAGDQLITVGSSFLQDSMRIKVVEDKEKKLAQEKY
ncbi:MAG TPA: efflux RND transporter periplasmic adaptor subunit [Fodinibius sp.]|nr:efflux RND transporter periplasmic adaptor subunit [Fodinibius sp.]